MSSGKFATVINCMDGRTQLPVNEWIRKRYKVDYVDTITEPGSIRILAETKYGTVIDSFKTEVDISTHKHGSKVLAIVGHHDCAGNPVPRAQQEQQIREALVNISRWGFEVTLVGLYVDEKWMVNEVGSG